MKHLDRDWVSRIVYKDLQTVNIFNDLYFYIMYIKIYHNYFTFSVIFSFMRMCIILLHLYSCMHEDQAEIHYNTADNFCNNLH